MRLKELVENGTMKKEELNEFINGRIMKNKKIFQNAYFLNKN